MVGRHDRVVLTGFGVAQVERERKLTETGGFIGSPEYIAPERVLGLHPVPSPTCGSWASCSTRPSRASRRSAGRPLRPRCRRSCSPNCPPRQAGELTGLLKGLLARNPRGVSPPRAHGRCCTPSRRPPRPRAHAPTTAGGAPTGRPAGGAVRGRTGPAVGAFAALTALVLARVLVLSRDGVWGRPGVTRSGRPRPFLRCYERLVRLSA